MQAAGTAFDIRTSHVEHYLSAHADTLLADLDEATRPLVVGAIKRAQRLYRVSTGRAAFDWLLTQGYGSAFDIAQIPQQTFVARAGAALGEQQALMIHSRATATSDMLLSVYVQLNDALYGVYPAGLLDGRDRAEASAAIEQAVASYLPTWSALFGQLAWCDCPHCRSVYSPAAYLVDLLNLLDSAAPNAQGQRPLDLLLSRRPDLAQLKLTCENTNTLIPYVDLVNEVLESLVGSLDPLQIPPFDTDGATAAEQQAAPQHTNWAAYRTPELPDARPRLDRAIFPPPLPFDAPLLATRSYLEHLTVRRADLIAVFASGPLSNALAAERLGLSPALFALITGVNLDATPASPAATLDDHYGWSLAQPTDLAPGAVGGYVWALKRKLNSAGAGLVIGANPAAELFDAATETAVQQFQTGQGLPVSGSVGAETWPALLALEPPLALAFLPHVPVFLERAALQFNQLLDLLTMRFVNPAQPTMALIEALRLPGADLLAFIQAGLQGASPALLAALQAAGVGEQEFTDWAQTRLAGAAWLAFQQTILTDGPSGDPCDLSLPLLPARDPALPLLADLLALATHDDLEAATEAYELLARLRLLIETLGLQADDLHVIARQLVLLRAAPHQLCGYADWELCAAYARVQAQAAQPALRLARLWQATDAAAAVALLAELLGWPAETIAGLIEALGLGLAELQLLVPLERLIAAGQLVQALGVAPAQAASWAREPVGLAAAEAARRAVKARYDQAAWLEVARSLSDPLRAARRAACVAYLLPRMGARDANALYQRLLIDVEISPCMQTSRIKQAIASVQLFVQRCLLNLEPLVAPRAIDSRHWSWLQSYRVWEANRKVLLYPENWIRPELRDDKTPFFAELEAALRATHETAQLRATLALKQQQEQEAGVQLEALNRARAVPVERLRYSRWLMGSEDLAAPEPGAELAMLPYGAQATATGGVFLIEEERQELTASHAARAWQAQATFTEVLASAMSYLPNFSVVLAPMGSGTSMSFGGSNYSAALGAVGRFLAGLGAEQVYNATHAAKMAGYRRRGQEYAAQANTASREIMQLDRQITAATIRLATAKLEREQVEQQIARAELVEEQLRTKYTNTELYGWMQGQITGLYFQSYQLAYELAKQAERCFRFERGVTSGSYIQFMRMFSLRHEFPTEWHRLRTLAQPDGDHTQTIALTRERFPLLFRRSTLTISRLDLFGVPRPGAHPTALRTPLPEGAPVELVAGAPLAPLLHQVGAVHVVVAERAELAGWRLTVGAAELAASLDQLDDLLVVCHYSVRGQAL